MVTCAIAAERAEGREVADPRGPLRARARDRRARAFTAAGGAAVRLLHPRHRPARQAPARPEPAPDPRRDRPGHRRPPLPLHRLRADRRRHRADGAGLAAARPLAAAARGRRRRPAARALPRGASWRWATGPTWPTCSAPGLLHGALVLSAARPRPGGAHRHVAGARRCPGVRAVVTAADVPGERWYGLLYDDWPGFVAEGEEVRCVGDVLAAVAADDEAHGARRRGAGAGRRTSCCRRCSTPRTRWRRARRRSTRSTPTCSRARSSAAATRPPRSPRSAHVVSGTWHTQRIEHLFLEPEARWPSRCRDGRLALYTPGPGRLRRPPPGGALPRASRRSRSTSSWCRTAAPSAARRTCRCRPRRRCWPASPAGR